MSDQRRDGAKWVQRLGQRAVPRCITIKPELDQLVTERMDKEGLTYSAICEEALRALFAEKVA